MDLEKQRDEKCIPVSEAIYSEMITGLVNTKDDHKELTTKALSVMLSKDLNITTEVSYVPQLILKSLSEINTTLQECDTIPEDDERYGSIGSKILEIGNDKEKLNQLFSDEHLTKLELVYIKDMIFQSFTAFNNILSNSITMATEKAESKALGVETMTDLSLKRLDEFLKA